jgi:hypothetical protein
MAMKVLVTDGDQRPALAIVRALGRRGAPVVVGEEHPRAGSSMIATAQMIPMVQGPPCLKPKI